MSGCRATAISIAAVLLAASPASAAILDCTAASFLDWRSQSPRLIADERGEDDAVLTIHLDPVEGRWFISNSMSRALVIGGGTFTVLRSGFERYYDEWIGVDGDTMLRIHGDAQPYPFVFIDGEYQVITGTCVAPDEPFLLLGGASP